MIGYIVEATIEDAHRKLPDYPLLRGDLLVQAEDGTYTKEFPGIAVANFKLAEDQKAFLRQVEFERFGLNYRFIDIDWDKEYK